MGLFLYKDTKKATMEYGENQYHVILYILIAWKNDKYFSEYLENKFFEKWVNCRDYIPLQEDFQVAQEYLD